LAMLVSGTLRPAASGFGLGEHCFVRIMLTHIVVQTQAAPSVVMHTYNLSSWETEARGS
jgi:hypothetical protein